MKQPLNDEDRSRIARAWRTSGMTQPAYSAAHGITDRTLRMWIARWDPPRPSGTEVVRAVCERAIERLRALVDGLDQKSTAPGSAPEPKNDAGVPGKAPAVAPQGNMSASGTHPRSFDLSNLGTRY